MVQLTVMIAPNVSNPTLFIHIVPYKLEGGTIINPFLDGDPVLLIDGGDQSEAPV